MTDPLVAAAVAQVEQADDDYRQAIDQLRGLVDHEKPRWTPSARAAFDQALGQIDAAIAGERAQAGGDPASPAAHDALYASYQREIDLMQDALLRDEAVPQ